MQFHGDAALEPPSITAWPADGSDGRVLVLSAAGATQVLSTEALEVGALAVPGAVVALRCDGCAPVTLHELPVRVGALPGAGPRRVTLALEASGVKCPPQFTLSVDASPPAAPALTSHALLPAIPLFVASTDAPTFSAPSSGFPNAQLQVRVRLCGRRVLRDPCVCVRTLQVTTSVLALAVLVPSRQLPRASP